MLVVVALAAQRLPREVVLALRDGEFRLAVPLGRHARGLVVVHLQFFFLRDHRRDLPARHVHLVVHLADQLIQHLLRVFGMVDHVVDVGAHQPRHPVENTHPISFSVDSGTEVLSTEDSSGAIREPPYRRTPIHHCPLTLRG